MNLPSLTKDALIKASRKNELIEETATQIQKDFAEFGLEINFSGNVACFYEELFDQMKKYVEELLGESNTYFAHFLYRIDISEQQIMQYAKEYSHMTTEEQLTELIIHRELKKIMIRDYFRQQNKE